MCFWKSWEKVYPHQKKEEYTCTIDRSESSPSNDEARTGIPMTGNGVSAATMPKHGEESINIHMGLNEFQTEHILMKTNLASEKHHQHQQ